MTHFKLYLSVCSGVFLISVAAFAQSRNTGEIRGAVTDPQGAMIPGATVTVTNIDTNVIRYFVTNENGIYDTVSTPAGNYKISFSAKGFKKLVRGPVTLEVDVITENATLQLGEVNETVSVSAEGVPLLETETSKLGTVLESKTMQELPQIGAGITGNDWANFNVLLPGASSAPSQPTSEGSGAYNAGDAIALNGNMPNYANYLQDGGVVQLPVSNNVDNTVFEAVQEVQINTSSFSAEYGIGGAVFNQITKSGTNSFHGSGYEYWQNNVLNAPPYFWATKNHVFGPQPASSIRYDEYGGSIGGPIIKNKLFFFFVTDKIFNNQAQPATLGNTPTLAERGNGTAHPGAFDFTGLPTLYDPASCNTPGCTRTSFAAENSGPLAGVNAIPGNRIDPVAARILSYYPLPNTGNPNSPLDNFTTVLSAPNPNLRFFGRLDYDLSSKTRISGSISQKNNAGVTRSGPYDCPNNCFSSDIDGYNAQVTVTTEFTPTLVNEFRMAYTKQSNWFVPFGLGFNPTSSLGLQYSKANLFPVINVNGGGDCCAQLTGGTNAIYNEHLYDPSDVVTLIKGRHVLHFGAEVLMGEANDTNWGNITSGNFTFTGNYTSLISGGNPVTGTGAGLADFLLGDVQKWSATNSTPNYARLKSPQLFAQDDFKVRPNLTVNLGLRYVATTGWHEKYNALGGFNPNLTLVCSVDSTGAPCGNANHSLGSMWFAPQDGRDSLQKPIHDIFLPRVGFAWSFRPDTVIRSGFGMYSYNFSIDTYGGGIGTGALTTSTGNASDPFSGTGPNPLITLSAPASVAASVLNYVVGSPNAKNVSHYLNLGSPSGQTYVPYDVRPGMIDQWQLSVEHQFGNNYMASLAYVGSHAYNLQFPTDINQITNPTLLQEIAAGTLPAGQTKQSVRPFPYWGSISGNNYNAISNYDALQVAVNKHFADGLLFGFNYVWSHMLDDVDSSGWNARGGTQDWQIGNRPGADYGNSNFDIPNAFKGYAAYDLPFGKGKTFLNTSTLLDRVIGGWKLSGSVLTQSGNPFTVTVNSSNYVATITDCGNGCVSYPNVIGNPNVGNQSIHGWFNAAAFVTASPTGAFAFGNEARNSLRGPRLTVFNLSLGKTFAITERVHLEFRSDWVNAFNHPSFNTPGDACNLGSNGVCIPGANNFGLINPSTQGGGIAVAPRSGQLIARITF